MNQTTKRVTKRRSGAELLIGRLLLLASWAFAVWIVSCLAGEALLEKARKEAIRATERATDVRMDVALLRRTVDRLTNMRAVDQWAALRGYVQPESVAAPTEEPQRVALRR